MSAGGDTTDTDEGLINQSDVMQVLSFLADVRWFLTRHSCLSLVKDWAETLNPRVWSIHVGKTRAYMWPAVLYACVTNKMKEVRWHLRPDNLSGYPCQPLFNSRLYLNPFTPKQGAIFGTAGGLVCSVYVCVRRGRCFWTLVHPFSIWKYIYGT